LCEVHLINSAGELSAGNFKDFLWTPLHTAIYILIKT